MEEELAHLHGDEFMAQTLVLAWRNGAREGAGPDASPEEIQALYIDIVRGWYCECPLPLCCIKTLATSASVHWT